MKVTGLSELGKRTAPPAISWLMQTTLERPNLISLAAGFTDNASLPVEITAEILKRIFSKRKRAEAALQYGATPGDPGLRHEAAARLGKMDLGGNSSPVYNAENLVITHGSQQLLYLVTECLCDPGDIVLVEDPTYFVYLGILQSHGIHARGITMREDGLDLDRLVNVLENLKSSGLLPRVKMLYLVTYFQNPSGVTTSFEKKIQALEILRRYEKDAGHPIYLLEDAAYRELRFTGNEEPSALAATKTPDRVIYAGTFSKPFATGIRAGYGWLPEPLRTVLPRVKGNHDFGTANLLQQILLEALRSGLYEEHLGMLRRRYQKKAAEMARAMRDHFPAWVKWRPADGGLYIWAELPKNTSTGQDSPLFAKALAKEVLYVPGELCYAPDPTRRTPRNQMRISFGGAAGREIKTGVERLGSAMHAVRAGRK